MKRSPEVIDLDLKDLESKLDQIEAITGRELVEPFRQLLDWCGVLFGQLRDRALRIEQLERLFSGSSTERTSEIFPASSGAPGGHESVHDAAAHAETPSSATSSESISETGENPKPRRIAAAGATDEFPRAPFAAARSRW